MCCPWSQTEACLKQLASRVPDSSARQLLLPMPEAATVDSDAGASSSPAAKGWSGLEQALQAPIASQPSLIVGELQ